MKYNKPVGVFDSGMGGITILSKLLEYLPHEDYIYYGDSLNNPYGEKLEEEILKYATFVSQYLIDKGCKAIVIACNTASSVAVDYLREKFPDTIFIATMPALKVAMDEDRNQNVLVMATKATLRSKKFYDLYELYKEEQSHIYLLNCSNLANLIEEEVLSNINLKLKKLLTYYKNRNINTVVLGCTHYPLIKENIKELLGNVKMVEGSDGISRQLKKKLEEKNLLNTKNTRGVLIIYNSLGERYVKKTKRILRVYQSKLFNNFEEN